MIKKKKKQNIRTFPAKRVEMMPLLATKQSANVVLPENSSDMGKMS